MNLLRTNQLVVGETYQYIPATFRRINTYVILHLDVDPFEPEAYRVLVLSPAGKVFRSTLSNRECWKPYEPG